MAIAGMYQAHSTEWLRAGFILVAALAAALAGFAHFRRRKLFKPGFFLLIGMAILMMAMMNWQEVSDDEQLRGELKLINPLSVSNLIVRREGNRRDIVSTNDVNLLFRQLQRVDSVPAHHSGPIDPCDVEFRIGGHEYQYRVARDSARPDEYWVLETARAGEPGREIGRVQSGQLGPMLEQLVTRKP